MKAKLVKLISKKLKVNSFEAKEIIEAYETSAKEILVSGHEFRIKNLVAIKLDIKEETKKYNIATQQVAVSPRKFIVKAVFSKWIKEIVSKKKVYG